MLKGFDQEKVETHFETQKNRYANLWLFLWRHYVNAMSVRIKMNNSRFESAPYPKMLKVLLTIFFFSFYVSLVHTV